MESVSCPALFLSAPASGQGKTTITAALARLLKRQGKKVRVFKTGPDYLDPQVLEQASGLPVVQVDLWMAGQAWCQHQLYLAAQEADLILVEGAMGMFDGSPSSADLAAFFNIPIVIVMDVKGMAQTAAAIATGLAGFRNDIRVAGIIANNCSTERHRQLIEESLPQELPLLLHFARSESVALPERHLGLVQASEVRAELEHRIEAGADYLESAGASGILERIEPVCFAKAELSSPPKLLNAIKIGVARDEAFSFIYDANIELLKSMGAELLFFSPLRDSTLPVVDALWLPGGYPELHACKLSQNTQLISQIEQFFESNKPILAECGGFLYCIEALADMSGLSHPMLGLIPGEAAIRDRRGCQGMQSAPLPEGLLRGHAHHRSSSIGTPEPIAYGVRQRHPAPGEEIYRSRRLTASYLHLFFPSNPQAIADLFLNVERKH